MSGFPCPALGRSNIADKKFAQAPFSRYVVESVSNAHPMPADSAEKLKWADNFGPFSREQVFLAGLRTKRIGDLMQARHLSDGFGEVDQWSGRTWQKRFHGAEVPEDVVTQLPFTEVQKKNAYIRPAKGSYFPCWELNFMQKENVVVPRPKAIKTYHPSKSLLRDDPFWDAPKETPSAPEMRITDTGKYDTVMKTTNGFPRWTILPKKIDPKW